CSPALHSYSSLTTPPPPTPTLFPYTTLFRSPSQPPAAPTPNKSAAPSAAGRARRRSIRVTSTLDAPASNWTITGFGTTPRWATRDRKSTRLNSSHLGISYAVFCLKKKKHVEY